MADRQRTSGSTSMTMPGPPPKGRSSTRRYTPSAKSRKLPQAHINRLRLEGTTRHAHRLKRGEQFGKQGDDVEANGHRSPPVKEGDQ
jgi:hypothetical protein